jgi:pyruvate/2-oxoglutarate dehydrogenase complex dihydrolipoamide dehydrogenase (E3) component
MTRYDNNLVVIGAGSAGLVSSLIAATVKATVSLVERGEMGGDCLNTGCVPSKTLIASARLAHQMRNASDYGIRSETPDVDFAAVMARVHEAIATIAPHDSVERYTDLGVNCVQGEAQIVDPHHVRVNDEVLSTRSMVIATGASPFIPPIPGLKDAEPLTSDNLWSLQELPARLCVLGGGPIGCELAQAFSRLGARVTLVDMAPALLPREDADVSQFVAERFSSEGIDLRLGCRAESVDAAAGVLKGEGPDGPFEVAFDRILTAVGRVAHSAGFGLEEIGVQTQADGTLAVDEYLRTTVPNLFGCGDVVGPYQFTHMASHQAWYASVNALFGKFKKFKVNYSVVPWTTYVDPEVARVGLSEGDAEEQGIDVEVTRYPLAGLDRAIADGHRDGWVKVLTPANGKDRILGATIVGDHAGELIAEMVLAMTHGMGLKKLMGTIHVYPTWMEANKFAASTWRRAHAPARLLSMVGQIHKLLR